MSQSAERPMFFLTHLVKLFYLSLLASLFDPEDLQFSTFGRVVLGFPLNPFAFMFVKYNSMALNAGIFSRYDQIVPISVLSWCMILVFHPSLHTISHLICVLDISFLEFYATASGDMHPNSAAH